jgi:hypothetical protein
MDSACFPNADIYKDTKVLKTDYKQYLLGDKTQCIGCAEYNNRVITIVICILQCTCLNMHGY